MSPADGPVDSYFVCATPRTGSSLLLGLLESTGVAGHPEAYFREPDEDEWAERWSLPRSVGLALDYTDFVRAARVAGSSSNGIFGAKLMWGTLDHVVDQLRASCPDVADDDVELLRRAFGRIRFIHLSRGDLLAQAVSWLRAEQTNTWYVGQPDPGTAPPNYDRAAIDHFLRTIVAHNEGWTRWFTTWGIEPHQVHYEDLDADPVGVTREILDFLAITLPPGGTITPHHQRQADEVNREWMDRYRATATAPPAPAPAPMRSNHERSAP